MYDELIKSLRICSRCDFGQDCNGCTQKSDDAFCCDKLLHQAADAIEGLSHAVDQMTVWRKNQWIPVTERLPEKDRQHCIIWDGRDVCEAVYFKDSKWHWCDPIEEYFDYENVTHWMPLPQPPKESE